MPSLFCGEDSGPAIARQRIAHRKMSFAATLSSALFSAQMNTALSSSSPGLIPVIHLLRKNFTKIDRYAGLRRAEGASAPQAGQARV
jgi:hypothetical protein